MHRIYFDGSAVGHNLDNFTDILTHGENLLPVNEAGGSARGLNFPAPNAARGNRWLEVHDAEGIRLSLMIDEKDTPREFPTAAGWGATTGQIQTVDSDESAGYDRSQTPRPPSQLAMIPVDSLVGYSRALGYRSRVVILGRSGLVMGRVCTNIIMAENWDIQDFVFREDMIAIGRPGNRRIAAEEAANPSEIFNSEFVVRRSPGIPRIVVS